MKKQSYVNTKDIHEIPLSILQPFWHDSDLHLKKESYQKLVIALFQQNVAKLAIKLEDHGLSGGSHGSAHTLTPAPILDCGVDRDCDRELRYGTRYIGVSSPPSLPAQYGTFTPALPATHQRGPIAVSSASYAGPSYHARVAYSGHQHVPSRPDALILPYYRDSAVQHTVDAGGNEGSNCPQILVAVAVVLVIAYFVFKT